MEIGSIGSNNYYMGQLSSMRGGAMGGKSGQMGPMAAGKRPDPAAVFEKTDTDGSGGLDQTEFESLASRISEATGEEVDAEALFATYDEDGDGVLSEDETQALMADHRPEGPPPGGRMGGVQGGPPPDLTEIVSDADEDEDGAIDETEAQQLAELISNANDEDMDVASLFEAYDADGDGVLSEAEALTALEENRPEGSPPPREFQGMMAQSENFQTILTGGIDQYSRIAAMGGGLNRADALSALPGGNENSYAFGWQNSVNTRI